MKRKRTRGIRRLVVVDDRDQLVGLVTQTDMLRAHALEIEKHRVRLARQVEERTRELREANDRLEALSLLDGLLGIGNRRAMHAALDKQHAQADRYGRPYAVALLDVDHFKAFNDCYGHPEADGVLQRIAATLADVLRGADSLYRYGGEEILMLLPETTREGAGRAAERARQAIETLTIEHEGSPLGVVTVSVGVAFCPAHGGAGGWRRLVEAADSALYAAKHGGRNRVEAAPQEPTEGD